MEAVAGFNQYAMIASICKVGFEQTVGGLFGWLSVRTREHHATKRLEMYVNGMLEDARIRAEVERYKLGLQHEQAMLYIRTYFDYLERELEVFETESNNNRMIAMSREETNRTNILANRDTRIYEIEAMVRIHRTQCESNVQIAQIEAMRDMNREFERTRRTAIRNRNNRLLLE